MPKEQLSRSRALAAKVLHAALQILKEKGGQVPGKEVIEAVPGRVEFDDWASRIAGAINVLAGAAVGYSGLAVLSRLDETYIRLPSRNPP